MAGSINQIYIILREYPQSRFSNGPLSLQICVKQTYYCEFAGLFACVSSCAAPTGRLSLAACYKLCLESIFV